MQGVSAPQLSLQRATDADVDATFALYQACVRALLARGIRQWDERYPTRATAADAAARGDLFHLVDGAKQRVGSVILNDLPAPEYEPLHFRHESPALIIHTFVLHPDFQGRGLSRPA